MGLLGNILSDAISGGVKKGIGNAIEKAVEAAVKPAADKLAEKGAEQINAASEAMAQNTAEIKKATAEASQADASTSAGSGFAGLEAALSGLSAQAERYAAEMSKNLKICPSCGEACSATNEFCPSCGAKLPEETAAAEYTCPKCGEVNVPGHTHCTKCGATLPAGLKAEAESASALEKFAKLCPQYPAWNAGGREFSLEDCGMQDGYPCYRLNFKGGQANINAYLETLKAAGFKPRGGHDDAETYFKVIDGVPYAFNRTDALQDNDVSLGFFVCPECLEKPAQQAAQPDIDVAKIAKGLFKKLF